MSCKLRLSAWSKTLIHFMYPSVSNSDLILVGIWRKKQPTCAIFLGNVTYIIFFFIATWLICLLLNVYLALDLKRKLTWSCARLFFQLSQYQTSSFVKLISSQLDKALNPLYDIQFFENATTHYLDEEGICKIKRTLPIYIRVRKPYPFIVTYRLIDYRLLN